MYEKAMGTNFILLFSAYQARTGAEKNTRSEIPGNLKGTKRVMNTHVNFID
jgi:hypothetical protein